MVHPKCTVCSYVIWPREYVTREHGDLMHVWCYRILRTQGAIRDSKELIRRSREMTNRARALKRPRDD